MLEVDCIEHVECAHADLEWVRRCAVHENQLQTLLGELQTSFNHATSCSPENPKFHQKCILKNKKNLTNVMNSLCFSTDHIN